MTTKCSHEYIEAKSPLPEYEWQTLDVYSSGIVGEDQLPTVSAVCTIDGIRSFVGDETTVQTVAMTQTLHLQDLNYGWKVLTVLGEATIAAEVTMTESGQDAKATGRVAQAGDGSGTESAMATTIQTAGACEMTSWVNAIVVLAAAAAMAV